MGAGVECPLGFSRGACVECPLGFSRGVCVEFPLGFSQGAGVECLLGFSRGAGVECPLGFFKHFSKIILCGLLPISVAIPLCLRHVYCEFGENQLLNIADLNVA